MTADGLMAVGRIVFGGFFAIACLRNFLGFEERRRLAGTNYGWVLPAPIMALGFLIQGVGGLCLLLNLWTVPGAVLLIAFLCLATPLYHNPLMFSGKDRAPHLYLSLVNVTLAAGLLMVIAGALR